MISTPAKSMDEYIAGFPKDIQEMLELMRDIIRKSAPSAEETIKYAIPTFVLNKSNLVSFAGWKKHIGFYPAPRGVEALQEALAPYEGSKGTLKFPTDEPLPVALIRKVVKFLVERNSERAKAKK
jgi:uncharacterized protein YdhG (YjbR/CyaY superfamily)